MQVTLPKLNYAYDALEPVIDARTMEIHHTKHHQAYVDNLNNAIKGTEHEGKTIEEICKTASDVPAIRNNGGGHFNHTLFWEILTPGGSKEPVGNVKTAIEAYGGFEKFKEEFTRQAMSIQGSGWIYLSRSGDIKTIKNHAKRSDIALLVDWWEHAWFDDYGTNKSKYLKELWKIINWNVINSKL